MPLVMVAAVAATAWNVEGNSIMIFPSAGKGLPVWKARAEAPAAPATKLAGVTVGVWPLKIEGVNVTEAGRVPPEAVASSMISPPAKVVLRDTKAPEAPAYF